MLKGERRYKIIVIETICEDTIHGGEWKQGAGQSEDDKDKYGYTPEIISAKVVEREVYSQDVDKLNLTDVIAAVNNMTSYQTED